MDFSNMTREQLVAALQAKTAKKKPTRPCYCGCGGETQGRFVPGHDARFHGWARKIAKGELTMDEVVAVLPHDEAKEEMAHCVEHMRPKLEAEARLRAEKAVAKAKERAAELISQMGSQQSGD